MTRLLGMVVAAALPLAAPPAGPFVVPTGPAPCGATARFGSLWIGVYEAGTLLRLDARGRILARVRVGPWTCRVAVGNAAVWVTRDRADELVRLPRGSGRPLRVRVAEPFDVLLAKGSVWATSHASGAVVRLHPESGDVLGTVDVGPRPAGLTLCGGRIWVGHGASTSLSSVHPTTLGVRRVRVGAAEPGWPACIGGKVWAVSPDTVVRIDPASGRVLSRLRLGETLADAAEAPDGYVWVTDKKHALVHRLTADGRSRVDGFPAGPGAFALARLGASMWVTSFAGSDVRRFEP